MPSLEIKLSDGFGILSRMQRESGRRCRLVVIARKGVETFGIRRDGEKSTPRIKIIKDLPGRKWE